LATIDDSGVVANFATLAAEPRRLETEPDSAGRTARERIRKSAAGAEREPWGTALPLDGFHPLTAARWTVVDRFEENGHHYVVARENHGSAVGFEVLTERERQVVVQAALGSSNKEIASRLGISAATVRVLMARAANRLGVHGRKPLLAHPALGGLRRPEEPSS